ncbi:hypothetical protein V8E51_012789 [Hyaloscypha variabilis]
MSKLANGDCNNNETARCEALVFLYLLPKGSTLNNYPFPDAAKCQSDTNYFNYNDAALSMGLDSAQEQSLISNRPPSFAPLNMTMASSNYDAQIEKPDLPAVPIKLRCQFPDCSEDRVFPTEAALRKHQDKHTKPFNCSVPGCRHPQFSDKGGFDRHTREVHGNMAHYCPIPSCKRHTKGFPRKYNLFEHQKRCHPGQSLSSGLTSMRRSPSQDIFEGEDMNGARDGHQEPASPETMDIGDVTEAGSGKLHKRLRGLLETRTEIDKDIEALKRVLDFVDDS